MGEGGGDSAEYGYNEFIADIDAIVMGRKTFEKVLTFDKWYYGKKRVVVLTDHSIDLSVAQAREGVVEVMAGSPAEIVDKLVTSGARRLYVDGGITIQEFLRAGLIQRLIISRLPVLIGVGIPLFGSLPRDIRLSHIATRTYPGGMVQSEYRIVT
jgi:dihydrofolate reductase